MVEWVIGKGKSFKLFEDDTLLSVEYCDDDTHFYVDKFPLTTYYEDIVRDARRFRMIKIVLDLDDTAFDLWFLKNDLKNILIDELHSSMSG